MTDCLVIGGGIIGLMTAHYLLGFGYSVVVIEKGYYGKESSWAGAGILSPLYPWRYGEQVNQLSQQSQAVYRDLCAQIKAQTGIESGYRSSGLLVKDDYDNQAARIWQRRYQVQCQITAAGLLLNKVAQVRNPWLLNGLKALLYKQGGQLLEQMTISAFLENNTKVEGVIANGKKYRAANIIICGGAWSAKLLNLLKYYRQKMHTLSDDIFPIKGEILLFTFPEKIALETLLPHILLAQGRYLVPRGDNLLLVGTSYEQCGFDKSLNAKSAQMLYRFAQKYIAPMQEAKLLKHWSGLRPATHSKKIHIGKLDDYENLYINAGHFSNGINTAPASAKCIVNLIGAKC